MRILLFLTIVALSHIATSQLIFEDQITLLDDFEPNYLKIDDANNDGNKDIIISSFNEDFITLFLEDEGFVPKNIIVGEEAIQRGIVLGDFNADGFTDIAVTDFSMDRVSILFGTSANEFANPSFFDVESEPVDIAVADVDNDGDLDLAVANRGDNSISVLLNNGGDFTTSSSFNVENEPETVRCQDLNDDGFVDLIGVNKGSNSISILLGSGNGGFSDATNFSTGSTPTEIQIEDFDTDSNLDIAVVYDGGSEISILYGEGDGDFATAENTSVTYSTAAGVFTAMDLNGDNTIDIAVNARSQRETILLFNDGSGSFTESSAEVTGSGGTHLSDVIAADLFGTGIGLVSTNLDSYQIGITFGDGMGNFNSFREVDTTPAPYRLTENDFNNDGLIDIASANHFSGFVSVFINNGERGFFPAINKGGDNFSISTIQSGDVDNDGFIDILAGSQSSSIVIFFGDETGEFQETSTFSISLNNSDFKLKDINGDDDLDIVCLSGVYLGDGNGSFALSDSFFSPIGGPLDLTVCDLDGDGFMDQIATDRFNDRIAFHAGNGDGTFEEPIFINVGEEPFGINTGDFNNDDVDDIAVSNMADGSISIILGTNETIVESTVISNDNASDPKPLYVVDIDNDQNDDIIVLDSQEIIYYLGDGSGSFSSAEELSTTFNPETLGIFDIDNNGKLDLLVGTQQTGVALTLHLADIAPTIAASNLVFSEITENSATITWQRGNGDQCIVIAKESSEVDGIPSDGSRYAGNPEFGTGDRIGLDNYVGYRGDGNAFTITGLQRGTEYHFAVIELNMDETYSFVNYMESEFLTGQFTTDLTLNIFNKENTEIITYPNPATNIVEVLLQDETESPINLKVGIFDYLGRQINIQPISKSTHSIVFDFRHLEAGVYLIRIQDGKKSVSHKVYIR